MKISLKKLLTNGVGISIIHIVRLKQTRTCTSGSVVEYRLAKARVAGSNPVSCFFYFSKNEYRS